MLSFRQIKIRHIFKMQFGGFFVKFNSRQIFRPYGTSHVVAAIQLVIPARRCHVDGILRLTLDVV